MVASVVSNFAGTEATTATTLVATSAAGTTGGHGLLVLVAEQNTTDVATSVTDSASNTYVNVALTGTAFVTNGGFSLWETSAASPTGLAVNGTVTAHFSSAIAAALYVVEISGANNTGLVTAAVVHVQATVAAYSSGNATPTGTQLAVGACGYFHAGSARTNSTAATIGGSVPSTSAPSATAFSNTTDGASHTTGIELNALAISAASALAATLNNATTIDGAVLALISNAAAATPGRATVALEPRPVRRHFFFTSRPTPALRPAPVLPRIFLEPRPVLREQFFTTRPTPALRPAPQRPAISIQPRPVQREQFFTTRPLPAVLHAAPVPPRYFLGRRPVLGEQFFTTRPTPALRAAPVPPRSFLGRRPVLLTVTYLGHPPRVAAPAAPPPPKPFIALGRRPVLPGLLVVGQPPRGVATQTGFILDTLRKQYGGRPPI